MPYVTRPMLHDGRFMRPTNISAVVFSLPDTTVLMEHPGATKPLSPLLRGGLIRLPYFKMELSLMEWRPWVGKGDGRAPASQRWRRGSCFSCDQPAVT